jgi:bacterioferritin-associated ferredoxin
MYVCLCNSVTDSDIRQAVREGVSDITQLGDLTGCSTGCGCCAELASAVLDEAMREQRPFLPMAPAACPS